MDTIILVCNACGTEYTPEEGHKECAYPIWPIYHGQNDIQEGLDAIAK